MIAVKAVPFEPAQREESDDPMLGSLLAGTYRIERLVAEGGMGRLYEGVHTRLQMKVAIKTMLELRGGRNEAIERAEREARAMASIASPHVARVLDLVRTADGRPCLVTELLNGEDLAVRLQREGKLETREAARIARDMARGLQAAHEQGVLHRDIKPSNVYLTQSGEVKLLDFGVAKLEGTQTLTHAGAFLGTPAYMSPEQAASASDVDERSDVYGLGAVLYHMLSGQAPYGDLDTTQTLTALLRGDPPRLTALHSSIPAGLAAVVEHAMSREADDRFASANELACALEPYASDGSTLSAEHAARWLRPKSIAAVVGAGGLAGVWTAALAYQAALALGSFDAWPPWARILLRSAPAFVLVATWVLCARSLAARWRSAPRVRALLTGLRRSVWFAAAALGAIATARPAAQLFEIGTGLPESHESILALVVAAGIAVVTAAMVPRLIRSRDRAHIPPLNEAAGDPQS